MSVAVGNRRRWTIWSTLLKVRIPALFTCRCSRNTLGPSKSELVESTHGFNESYRSIARGSVMNCSRSMTLSGMILGQEIYRTQIIKESRQVWKLNCFGKSWCQSSRIVQAIVCHSIRATRSTIFISIRTLFTATSASREFRFML